jgi:hypothetical protein
MNFLAGVMVNVPENIAIRIISDFYKKAPAD